MRTAVILVALALMLGSLALGAPGNVAIRDLPNHPFLTDLPPGASLRLYLRSGEIRIRGREDNRLSVRYDGPSPGDFRELAVRFQLSSATASLELDGGPDRDMHVVIEVPQKTSLRVQMSAGSLDLDKIVGDKDVHLRAGDLTIALGDPNDYARIHAAVLSGGLEAAPLGEFHGGLFRSFTRVGPGPYKLSARVLAGELTLH
jgi:hypothetical protein